MWFINKYYRYIIIFLILVFIFLEISSIIQENQTIDEGVHLSSGYSYLITGDFRMNTEHPPLLKELTAIPLLLIKKDLNTSFDSSSWDEYQQWEFAREFLYENNLTAETILLLGRIPVMVLSIFLGIFLFKWTKELFGIFPGLISLFFYVFSPNIIAHSRYVTTDLAFSLFFFITIYYFYQYFKSLELKYFILFSFSFAASLATKFSAIFLFPIIIFLIIILLLNNKTRQNILNVIRPYLKKIMIFISIIFFVIFSVYGFQIQKPIDNYEVQKLYTQRDEITSNSNIEEQNEMIKKLIKISDINNYSGKIINWVANELPIPSFTYLVGTAKVFTHNYNGHSSYLFGEHSKFGWWYYFPLTFLVKTPITTIIFLFSLVIILLRFTYIKLMTKSSLKKITVLFNSIPNYFYFIFIPPTSFFIITLFSSLNLGLRHILLIYPFIFLSFGWLINYAWSKQIYKYLFIVLMVFYAISSVSVYPHYLSYFNEFIGGPKNGSKYLSDSNIDWGQDLIKLKKYLQKNNIQYVCMSYFGQADLNYYNIDYRYLPDNNNFSGIKDLNCLIAISVTSLNSEDNKYSWLYNYTPDEKIGYSIYLYDFRKLVD